MVAEKAKPPAAVTLLPPGGSRPVDTRRATTSGPTPLSSAATRSRSKDGTFDEKRSVYRHPPDGEDRSDECRERQKGSAHLVTPLDHSSCHGGPHHCRAQRQEVHPGLCDRKYGGAQTGRIFRHTHLQRAFREGR